jgi:imidazoleglycerol-phosphate dehydratase
MRQAKIERTTKETSIACELNIDRFKECGIKTEIGFLSHMLAAFAKSGSFALKMKARGDLEVDQHHTVEDIGIVLGKAFSEALGDKKGINRAGYFVYPMDEALAVVAVDISGRPYLQFDAGFRRRFCGGLDTDTLEDFFRGFANGLQGNVVVRMPYGRSDHHKIESIFKAFGKAMEMAVTKNKRVRGIPSTKGVIQ